MGFRTITFHSQEPVKLLPFLMEKLALDEARTKRLVDKGRVLVEGVPVRRLGEPVQGEIAVRLLVPENAHLPPLFLHRDFALFDKPAGMYVHAHSFSGPAALLDNARHYLGEGVDLVHRLDRETSGLVLFARNPEARARLAALFQERKVEKRYLALVRGKVEETREIDLPILPGNREEGRLTGRVDPAGKPSLTTVRPLRYEECTGTLVELTPHTGRTHQLRIHLEAIGHPILGDPFYGASPETAQLFLDGKLTPEERKRRTDATRLMLHAHSLAFTWGNRFYLVSSGQMEEGTRDALQEDSPDRSSRA